MDSGEMTVTVVLSEWMSDIIRDECGALAIDEDTAIKILLGEAMRARLSE